MEGNLAILEGNFHWVPGKKHIFSSRVYSVHAVKKEGSRCSGGYTNMVFILRALNLLRFIHTSIVLLIY